MSYLTMVVPDLDAALGFYGGVVGWTCNMGSVGGAQVTGVAPQIGMTTQTETGPTTRGVIPHCQIDDIATATAWAQDAAGQAREVAQRPYGPWSHCAPTTRAPRPTCTSSPGRSRSVPPRVPVADPRPDQGPPCGARSAMGGATRPAVVR